MGYPLSQRGTLIGYPYVGTHNLGNWESDNAIDIGAAKGTNVFAVDDGTIGSQIGLLPGGNNQGVGPLAGYRLHLVTAANEWYYAHLSEIASNIKAGMKVRKGQYLGRSGVANGVQHLHIACERGNPQKLLGWK